MTFTDDGLVLGGTIPAPASSDPEVTLAAAEPRILALLGVAYGKAVRPEVLGNLRRAVRYRRQGENALAAIEIALSGLPPLADEKQGAASLSLGEQLLAAGLGARELVELCGLDPALFDVLKAGYDPDQPRIPAGNPEGGQWTAEGGGAAPATAGDDAGSPTPLALRPASAPGGAPVPEVSRVDPNIEFVSYTPVHGLPADAVVVETPDGRTITDPDSQNKKLMAPPRADFQQVYAAGHAISGMPVPSQIPMIRSAVGHGGAYDFQRDPTTGRFYHAYRSASNYAVGVFTAGAGYSLPATELFAESYAFLFSSNYGSVKTMRWIARGWEDATVGVWK